MIGANIDKIKQQIGMGAQLIAVSKTKPVPMLMEAYEAGQRAFGENKVQELVAKQAEMPADVEWHLIGHLQSNKVKAIAPFIFLIHSVDGFKLLEVINKEAQKNNRVINCLLQIFIADEESKFGLTQAETEELIHSVAFERLANIKIVGLMGMATNTDDEGKIANEFKSLKTFFDKLKDHRSINFDLSILSMGMSSDYMLAVDAGSNMVRVGSSIFGTR
jgi:pyridoxal phosphate enzyme (YggS family)